jgi:hypothetical protein
MNDQIDFIKEIARRLDSAGISYMLTGSLAMTFYATPRMTRDIDLVIELNTGHEQKITDLFSDDCYIDFRAVSRAIKSSGMFNIISNKLIIKADFIVKKDSDYRRLEFSRRKPVELDGQKIYIVSIEDLILSKLVWGKDSDSEFQLRDITNLLDSAEKLDWEYLEKWATKLNVKNYLRKANSDE